MKRISNISFRLDGNIPFSSRQGYRHLLGFSFNSAARAVTYPSNFRKINTAVPFIQLKALRIAKGVMHAFFLKTRQICSFFKKILVCLRSEERRVGKECR